MRDVAMLAGIAWQGSGTVRLIPEAPTFTTSSEQEVWQRLKEGLGADDVLLANLRLTDEDKDHEADLNVLMPDVGIVVVEVKGGSVWHDDDNGWWQSRGGQAVLIDPVTQVRTTKYAVRNYVGRDPRWQRRNYVAWGHAVVTPYSTFDAKAEAPHTFQSTVTM
ncbi:nuclease-related domain-containing protein [Nocardioides sp. URHA0020]|uniref:nuclease-related domain-containing protein n=1 Tax=Nocardioides sp. URHA0020 TaxID=1380392 RepID=UPI00048BA4E2|nr:nuclease-related domain-containing protein [Nocardioides sp. URHA0020]